MKHDESPSPEEKEQLEELRRELRIGIDEADRGELIDGEEGFEKIPKRVEHDPRDPRPERKRP